ncbi:MAG: cyclic nucleotide-binding domain-containing protein [Bacteroidetes bacterium]|nr:cyclic nucleotide-binding domain-containing protein [Bacteroidota bacterium]
MEKTLLSIETLRFNTLFKYVPDAMLQTIMRTMKEERFSANTSIFQENSRGERLYLILEGRVKISKITKYGAETVLAYLNKGEFFGEMELLDDQPRSARTVAVEQTTVASLTKQDFDSMLKSNNIIQLNMLKSVVKRLRIADSNIVTELDRTVDLSKQHINKLNILIEAAKTVNSTLDLDKLLDVILQTAIKSIAADRGTLYLVDELKGEIWSKVLSGDEVTEIRLPLGKGLAGYVAKTGEVVNIPDAYNDQRFNPDFDKKTGYRTNNMLTMPMKNRDGKIIGVFQMLNKKGGPFSQQDEEFINALSIHASIAIENARLAQEMVNSERLSAVGRMASTIIHDIKNPMGTLRVYAQVMKKKGGNEEVSKLADEMIHQVDRFVNMAQEILDFSKGVSSTNMEKIAFEDVMEGVLLFIEKDLTKNNIQLTKKLSFKGMVTLDQDKLSRVFYNLASNARDAMPNGGTLTALTEDLGDMVKIEFTDTGTGMPEEVKRRIFEPFVTHGKKHGTGLGMAIVKKVIDDHKGKIEIDSELGKGTTIRILLPKASA